MPGYGCLCDGLEAKADSKKRTGKVERKQCDRSEQGAMSESNSSEVNREQEAKANVEKLTVMIERKQAKGSEQDMLSESKPYKVNRAQKAKAAGFK
jgi:hypothetical protein